MKIKNGKELEFVLFCIDSVAASLRISYVDERK